MSGLNVPSVNSQTTSSWVGILSAGGHEGSEEVQAGHHEDDTLGDHCVSESNGTHWCYYGTVFIEEIRVITVMIQIKDLGLLSFGENWAVCDLVVRRHRANIYLSIRLWPCSFLNPCFLSIMLEVWLGRESVTIASGNVTFSVGSDFPSSVMKDFFWFLISWQAISHQRAMCQIIVATKAACPT